MKKLKKTVVVLIMLCTIPASSVFASWITWAGVATTGVGIGAALTPTGVGQIVGAGAGVVQVGCIITDVALTLFNSPPPPIQPIFAAFPEPSELSPLQSIFNANYQPLSLSGSNTAENDFIEAINNYIVLLNLLTNNIASAAPEEDEVVDTLNQMRSSKKNIANTFDNLGFSLTLSQSDYDNYIEEIATSGLPTFEVEFLNDAGWTSSDIQSCGDFIGNVDFNLAVSSVSANQVFDTCCYQPIPEPATMLLFGFGILGFAGVSRRKK